MRENNQCDRRIESETDLGAQPAVLNINRAAMQNKNYRTAIWTGEHLQVTLMSIPVGGDVGLEIHEDTDQFIRIVAGKAMVLFGKCKNELNERIRANGECAVTVPAGTWHNIVNVGSCPLKLYSIYAPPHHPFGTVQQSKRDAKY